MTLNSLTSVKQPKVLSHARKSMEQIDERREEKKQSYTAAHGIYAAKQQQ